MQHKLEGVKVPSLLNLMVVAKMNNSLKNKIPITERGLLETEEIGTSLGTSRRVKPSNY